MLQRISEYINSYNDHFNFVTVTASLTNSTMNNKDNQKNEQESELTVQYCEAIAMKITNDIPEDCKEFSVIKAILKKRETNHDDTIAFAGMSPGEIAAARAARQQGHLNPAQIQRRMTTRGSTRVW